MFVYFSIFIGIIAIFCLLYMTSKKKSYTEAIGRTTDQQPAQPTGGIMPGITKNINGHETSIMTSGNEIFLTCKINSETPLKNIMIDKDALLNRWQNSPSRTKIASGNPVVDKKLLIYVSKEKEVEAVAFFQNNLVILQTIAELYSMQFNLGGRIWESRGMFCLRYKEQGLMPPEKVQEVSNKMIEIFTAFTKAQPGL